METAFRKLPRFTQTQLLWPFQWDDQQSTELDLKTLLQDIHISRMVLQFITNSMFFNNLFHYVFKKLSVFKWKPILKICKFLKQYVYTTLLFN